MSAHESNTDPTLPPRVVPVTHGETVAAPPAADPPSAPAAEPVTRSAPDAEESGAETQVKPAGAPPAARPDDAPVVAGYELGAEIARGGMGVVYAARDLALDREVAVKVMLPGMSAAAFDRESRIAARLPHPGVPPVHALGALPDGRPFLAMKLIRGETLDTLLRARTDPAADRGRFVVAFEQMCQAVGYAHAQGIVHRDLKPSNVMVGAFGEVQVMDWGLAKAVGGADGPDATVPDGGAGGVAATVAGAVKGTPAYMAPEQARGEPVDARADVFALGGVLGAVLTGRAPFGGTSVLDTIVRAAKAELDDAFARLDASGADAELIALAKHCLAARAGDRPASGAVVAAAVAAYRAGVDARLRRAEQDTAAAEAKAVEQRKRRKVQLALAGVVALVLAGAGIATSLWIEQRADERLATEQQRQEDRRAAEVEARAQERRARADALVQSLGTAETGAVPQIVAALAEFRDLTGPALRALAERPVAEKPGLHARLALVADEPAWAAKLAAYLPDCRSDELLVLRDALKPHAGAVSAGLWAVVADPATGPGRRARAAGALAGLAPGDERWAALVPGVAGDAVAGTPAEFVTAQAALAPVGGRLVPVLFERYLGARRRIEGGTLDVPQLVEAAAGYDRTANLLARYAERPADLAEAAVVVDPRHYPLFWDALQAQKAAVVPILKAELSNKPPEKLPVEKEDAALEKWGRRRGHAGAALVALGEGEAVWPVFGFPKDGDPTARSYLLQRLALIGADPVALVRRFAAEGEVSAQRALLVALGDFPVDVWVGVAVGEREALAAKLLVQYREHPDPGLHGAIDWLLRQKWGKGKELAAIDAELAVAARGRVAARAVADAGVPVGGVPAFVGPLLPAPKVAQSKDWFVNGEGQTFAVVRGPVEFTLGSPASEPGRVDVNEPPHRKRIGRTFALATKEVTVAEFLRFRPKHEWVKRYSPGPDTPAVGMTWYEAAGYCNWLSGREGLPEDQWCYAPSKAGVYGPEMQMKVGHLKLSGYRLPTEAEWEFGCRGGAVTARYYGPGEELLVRYGRFVKNGEDRAWPVGGLRPNELGLFDMLGNAMEWVEDPALQYMTNAKEDTENRKHLQISESMERLLRGGSFLDQPVYLRSANRIDSRPGFRTNAFGFRPVRTLP